jgi:hypothetical protein
LILVPTTVVAAQHEVSGKGRFHDSDPEDQFRFEFSARGGPSEATGFLRWVERINGEVYTVDEGTVTCLKVQGNRMVIAGEVDSGLHAGQFFILRAEDNGKGKRRPVDFAAGSPAAGAPDACVGFDLSGNLDGFRLDRGDVTVR